MDYELSLLGIVIKFVDRQHPVLLCHPPERRKSDLFVSVEFIL